MFKTHKYLSVIVEKKHSELYSARTHVLSKRNQRMVKKNKYTQYNCH